MIIYQNKQDKSGDNKIIQKQLKTPVRNSLVTNNKKQVYLFWNPSERSEREIFFMILVQTKWHLKGTRNCAYETICPQPLIILNQLTKYEASYYNVFFRYPIYKFSIAKFAKGNNSKK